MAGFMEGYIGGLQFLSGLQDMDQRKQKFDLDIQDRQQAAYDNRQERDTLARVFRARADDQNTMDTLGMNNRLAQQYQQAGSEIMQSDPKLGLQMLKQADELRLRVQNAALEQANVGLQQDRLLAGRAANVFDQDSLTAFIGDMAKAGKVIPTKYQVWGPETEKWIEKQSMMGATGLQQKQLEITAARERNQEAQQQEREKRDRSKEQYEAAREARLRDGLELRGKAAAVKSASELSLKGEKDALSEVSTLESLDEDGNFKKLQPGLKTEAARDVRLRAQKLYADSINHLEPDQAISKEEALRLARQSVLGEIKSSGGSWNPFRSVERDSGSMAPRTPMAPEARTTRESAGGASGPAGKSAISPLPQSKESLVLGQIYQTSRGPALWKGDHFESLK